MKRHFLTKQHFKGENMEIVEWINNLSKTSPNYVWMYLELAKRAVPARLKHGTGLYYL